jgi:integral membrane protein
MLKYPFLRYFRYVAVVEGISFLLLFGITMPLKYYYEIPGPNMIVGSAHGFFFVLYAILLFLTAYKHKWTWLKMALVFAASIVPFGTFIADKPLFNEKPSLR